MSVDTDRVVITEVAPRDGLQNQPVHLATADKQELVALLCAAGVESVEATSFVSPQAVPQMADAGELLPRLIQAHPRLRLSALVPNGKGLARALSAGSREVAVVLSATDTMNRKNIRMSLVEATAECERTLHAARAASLRTRAYIAVAFECPFEGVTPIGRVVELAQRMLEAQADEIVIADTIGAAAPAQVKALLRVLAEVLPPERIGAHFHDTRGLGVANAWAAIEAGVRRFDASAGGLGGCPFAPGAAGNLATEDLVLMAQQGGLRTGVALEALLPVIDFLQRKLDRPLGGRCMPWLRRRLQGRAVAVD